MDTALGLRDFIVVLQTCSGNSYGIIQGMLEKVSARIVSLEQYHGRLGVRLPPCIYFDQVLARRYRTPADHTHHHVFTRICETYHWDMRSQHPYKPPCIKRPTQPTPTVFRLGALMVQAGAHHDTPPRNVKKIDTRKSIINHLSDAQRED